MGRIDGKKKRGVFVNWKKEETTSQQVCMGV